MQKPIGGLSANVPAQKTRGVGLLLAQKTPNSMLKTRTYLDPNIQSMQKTRRGVYPRNHSSGVYIVPLNEGGVDFLSTSVLCISMLLLATKELH
jgi:hypothetical protein